MFNVQRIMLEANCIFKVDRTISGDISALMLYRASEEEEEGLIRSVFTLDA